jgi:hypothetical protein
MAKAKKPTKKGAKQPRTKARKAWHKQPDESTQSHEAFRAYLKMGPRRTLAKVGKALGKSHDLMERWSVAHGWVSRIDAYEAYQDEQWDAERRRDARLAARRHTRLAMSFTRKLKQKLKGMTPEDLEKMTPGDMARWLDVAVKVERLSLGMSTATVTGTGAKGEIEHTHNFIKEASASLASWLGVDVDTGETSSVV